jgi:hypothetical protein
MDNNQITEVVRVPVPVRVLSITATVCGAMGLLFCWCYGGFIICSIAAIVTSTIANNKSNGVNYGKYTTMTKTGKITGIIGIIANVLTMIIFIALAVIGTIGILESY